MKRGQASLEYVVIFGVVIFALMPFIYFSSANIQKTTSAYAAEDAVMTLAKAVNKANSLGPGTRLEVSINIPMNVKNISFEKNTIIFQTTINGKVNDIIQVVDADVTGFMIPIKGQITVPIEVLHDGRIQVAEANDTYPPRLITTSPNGIIYTENITLVAITDEDSHCRYDAVSMDYVMMSEDLIGESTYHSKGISELVLGEHQYWISCNDTSGNIMSAQRISFTIDEEIGPGEDPDQAPSLDIDISQAKIDESDSRVLRGIYLSNLGEYDIRLVALTPTWNDNEKMTLIEVYPNDRWESSCAWGCSPLGDQDSGVKLDFGASEVSMSSMAGPFEMKLTFDQAITSDSLSFIFIMGDDTEKSIDVDLGMPEPPEVGVVYQSNLVVLNMSSAYTYGGGQNSLRGITLENINDTYSVRGISLWLTWTLDNAELMSTIESDSREIWSSDCTWDCSPRNTVQSGEIVEFGFRDITLYPGEINIIDSFNFLDNMAGKAFTLNITFEDGSSVEENVDLTGVSSSMADDIEIDISNAELFGSGNERLIGVTFRNNNDTLDRVIDGIEFSWQPDALETAGSIRIETLERWSSICDWGCTPSSELDQDTYASFGNRELIVSPLDSSDLDEILFSSDMSDKNITLKIYLTDGSSKSTTIRFIGDSQPSYSDFITVDASLSTLTDPFQILRDLTISNSADFDIPIKSMFINWIDHDTENTLDIQIGGQSVWSSACGWGCTPAGPQSYNILLGFGDRDPIVPSGGSLDIEQIAFDTRMQDCAVELIWFCLTWENKDFELRLILGDDTEKFIAFTPS